jgi:fumiquinazoline F synthetase
MLSCFSGFTLSIAMLSRMKVSIEPVDCQHLGDGYSGDSNTHLGDGATSASQDLRQIWEWNGSFPPPAEKSVYMMIETQIQARPEAPAICAWDGELTYRQLDQLVSWLASRLFDLGVGPGTLVPLCFQKCKWTAVAILGVIKTGGSFVLLDPELPRQRLQVIVRQLKSSLLLCSPVQQILGSWLVATTITIS